MSQRVTKIADRAIALLYFHAVKDNGGATLKELVTIFDQTGLGKPNITRLRASITKDRRATKISKDKWRLKSALKKKKEGAFDLSRLVQMLIELDHAASLDNCISVGLIVRAILDHVPPIFGVNSFAEIANNYNGTKSFKASMLHLENSSRKIADAYLHTKIRQRESLPNRTQVNFSNDLDVLLAEIVRIS